MSVIDSQRGILTNKIGLQKDFTLYPGQCLSVEPEYLRECRGVHEKVHDSHPSTRLLRISYFSSGFYYTRVHQIEIIRIPADDTLYLLNIFVRHRYENCSLGGAYHQLEPTSGPSGGH